MYDDGLAPRGSGPGAVAADGEGETVNGKMRSLTAACLAAAVSAAAPGCSDSARDALGEPPDGGGGSIAWGPRLGGSGLSALAGAEDEFAPAAAGAVARAARTAPNGASQSSLAVDGRTADEMTVRVVTGEDAGGLAHEISDGARIVLRAPSPVPRRGLDLAAFTDLIPGIEPDLSSYPHEVLGVWAWDGEAGAFWGTSPPVPPVAFGGTSPAGTATYKGDAAGLYAAAEAVEKFLADVEMIADFDRRTVGGTVGGFRTLGGEALGGLSVTLGETGFPGEGGPFSGGTSARTASGAVAGAGQWGARWSDGAGRAMGGTFGFAADDASLSVLGAFTACACASTADGNPDDPAATSR